ncbi:MAG: hypothetical protein ACPGRU_02810, partial [Candidatus Puniceispirillaceae bacterium]
MTSSDYSCRHNSGQFLHFKFSGQGLVYLLVRPVLTELQDRLPVRAGRLPDSKTGLARLVAATGYSLKGLKASWQHEAAFRQEVALTLVLFP